MEQKDTYNRDTLSHYKFRLTYDGEWKTANARTYTGVR